MNGSTPPNNEFDPNDPITAAWASQDESAAPALLGDPDALADSVAEAHRKDERKLLWLNIREVIPSIGIAGAFGWWSFDAPRPWAVLAAAALIFAVGCFLTVNSVRHIRADRQWGTTVREYLERRLAQVEHRSRLFNTIAWWYLLPIALAIALFSYGTDEGEGPPDAVSIAVLAGLFVIGYIINRRLGGRFDAEHERLKSVLADFDRTSTPEE